MCCFSFKDQRRDAYSIISSVSLYIDLDVKIKGMNLINLEWVVIYFQTLIDGLELYTWTCLHSLVKITASYANHSAFLELPEVEIDRCIQYLVANIPATEDMDVNSLIQVHRTMPSASELPEVHIITLKINMF